LLGGGSAERGLNLLQICERNSDGEPNGKFRVISLGGKNTVQVQKFDHVIIYSPGGGGYGPASSDPEVDDDLDCLVRPVKTSGSLHTYTNAQESA
jgi:N-methylhydantoinase B/oxoprolinase/acetone carboxylase alpha subunit